MAVVVVSGQLGDYFPGMFKDAGKSESRPAGRGSGSVKIKNH